MTRIATITSKGQLTLPVALRRASNLSAGDQVVCEYDGKAIRLVPKRKCSSFAKYRGIGNPGLPTGRRALLKYLRELRGE